MPTTYPVLTETRHAGGFMVSEANGHRSRDRVTLSGSKLKAGAVLGKVTANGKFVVLAPAASDGSQNAAGICWDEVDASAADKMGTIVARQAEVNLSELEFPAGITAPQRTAAIAALTALGIVPR